MKSSGTIILLAVLLLLAGCLLSCGCSSASGPTGEGPPEEPPAPAIVGTWLSLPHEPGGARDLYLFRDTGRADATVVPGDTGEPPDREVYLQGTWEQVSPSGYRLTGEEITHFFTNDSHSSRAIRDLLISDVEGERLYRESDPEHPLEKISDEPEIPSDMDVSIPWD